MPNMNGDHSNFQSELHPETSTVAEADLRLQIGDGHRFGGFLKFVLQCRIALGMPCAGWINYFRLMQLTNYIIFLYIMACQNILICQNIKFSVFYRLTLQLPYDF